MRQTRMEEAQSIRLVIYSDEPRLHSTVTSLSTAWSVTSLTNGRVKEAAYAVSLDNCHSDGKGEPLVSGVCRWTGYDL